MLRARRPRPRDRLRAAARDGDGLRQAQEIARRQLPETRPRLRACSIAAFSALANSSFSSTLGALSLRTWSDDAEFDAAAREPLLQQRPHPRLDVAKRLRQPQLQIEKAMVHGPNGDAMVARSSSCVSEAKPVMDLITTSSISGGSSSNCSS